MLQSMPAAPSTPPPPLPGYYGAFARLVCPGGGALGTLSKDIFERRTSTGSEAFSLFICLDANKLVLLSFFSLLKTIYPRVWTKPLPNDAKSPLPVDVRRSKTLFLKLPISKFCPGHLRAPGPFPSFRHARGLLSEYNYTEDFTGKESRLAYLSRTWINWRGLERHVLDFMHAFLHCLSSQNYRAKSGAIDVNHRFLVYGSCWLLNQISVEIIWKTSFHIYKTIHTYSFTALY